MIHHKNFIIWFLFYRESWGDCRHCHIRSLTWWWTWTSRRSSWWRPPGPSPWSPRTCPGWSWTFLLGLDWSQTWIRLWGSRHSEQTPCLRSRGWQLLYRVPEHQASVCKSPSHGRQGYFYQDLLQDPPVLFDGHIFGVRAHRVAWGDSHAGLAISVNRGLVRSLQDKTRWRKVFLIILIIDVLWQSWRHSRPHRSVSCCCLNSSLRLALNAATTLWL